MTAPSASHHLRPLSPTLREGEPCHAPEPWQTRLSGDTSQFAADPLAEAEAIKSLLAEAQPRLARLLAALKQHRRQAKAVAAVVQSLRQLPPLDP
jgi:hypothetical protein